MKTLNVPLEDAQFKDLWSSKMKYQNKTKRLVSWNKFLMVLNSAFELTLTKLQEAQKQ